MNEIETLVYEILLHLLLLECSWKFFMLVPRPVLQVLTLHGDKNAFFIEPIFKPGHLIWHNYFKQSPASNTSFSMAEAFFKPVVSEKSCT